MSDSKPRRVLNGGSRVNRTRTMVLRSAWISRLFDGTRIYWFLPVLIGVYALLGHPNTKGFLLPALCASVACGLALRSVDYVPLSLVSIAAITHAISYPIACVLNLSLDETGVYEDFLWSPTALAMWACTVGMLGLAVGVKAASMARRRQPKDGSVSSPSGHIVVRTETSPNMNLAITLVAVPYVLFSLVNNFYFHSQVTGGADAYDFDAATGWGFLGYLLMFSYLGVFLQIGRYVQTRTRIDGVRALGLIGAYMLLLAPSGSRDATLTVVVVALPAFWAWDDRWAVKLRVLVGVFVVFVVMTVVLQMYRSVGLTAGKTTLIENVEILSDTLAEFTVRWNLCSDEAHFTIARRLADYTSTGWYISTVPQTTPFRYLANVQYWPALMLPVFLRPNVPPGALQETAELTYESSGYGWHRVGEGSSPAMIIGDLYTRFGWPGIFWGMFLLGILLVKFDRYFSKPTIQRQTVFVMFWVIAWKALTQSSLTGLFILFTRTFVICWAISHVVVHAIRLLGTRQSVCKH